MTILETTQAIRSLDESLQGAGADATWQARLALARSLEHTNQDGLGELADYDFGDAFSWWCARLPWDAAVRSKIYSQAPKSALSAMAEWRSRPPEKDDTGRWLSLTCMVAPEALVSVIEDLLRPGASQRSLLLSQLELGCALLDLGGGAVAVADVYTCRTNILEATFAAVAKVADSRTAGVQLPVLKALSENPNFVDFLRNWSPAEAKAALASVKSLMDQEPSPARERAILTAMVLIGPTFLSKQAIAWMIARPLWRARLLDSLKTQTKVFWREDQAKAAEAFIKALFETVSEARAQMQDAEWLSLADTVLRTVTIASLYGQFTNMKALQVARGRLLRGLSERKYKVPRLFRPSEPNKRRVAVVLAHTDDSTENLTGLAYVRAFKAQGCAIEVFICPHNAGQHSDGALHGDYVKLADNFEVIEGGTERAVTQICQRSPAIALFLNSVTWGVSDYISLASLRIANVQATTYVAATTTGFPNMDVWISGVASERSSDPAANYSERLLMKPGSAVCFPAASLDQNVPESRKAREAKPIFISGANFYKLNRQVLSTWVKILAAQPDSVLRLYPFNPNWDQSYPRMAFKAWIDELCVEQNVDPARMELVGPWPSRNDMLANVSEASVYLDSFPHSGGLSTIDPLLVRLPVVSMRGTFQRGTQGADVLDGLQHPDWIADSEDRYIEIALELMSTKATVTKPKLAALTSSPILNERAFEAELEDVVKRLLRMAENADSAGSSVLEDRKAVGERRPSEPIDTAADAHDGLWRFGDGFSFEEAPDAASNISRRFRWTDGHSASLTVQSSVAGPRVLRLRLRTFVVGQSVGISFNGERLGWSQPLFGDIARIQTVSFNVDAHYGANRLEINPAETVIDESGRAIGVIFESLQFDDKEGSPPLPAQARWTALEGFHGWEMPPEDGPFAHPFRWSAPPFSRLTLFNEKPGAKRLIVKYRTAIPRQVVTAKLGDLATVESVPQQGNLAQEAQIVIEDDFAVDKYTLQLSASDFGDLSRPIGFILESFVFD